MNCTNCGYRLPAGAAYCPTCAFAAPARPTPPPVPQQPEDAGEPTSDQARERQAHQGASRGGSAEQFDWSGFPSFVATRQGRARTAKVLTALACLAAVGVFLVLQASEATRNRHLQENAGRVEAARVCLEALHAGEQAFLSGRDALTAFAAAVESGTPPTEQEATQARESVVSAQRPAQPGLTGCATDTVAPPECAQMAATLTDASARQEKQAGTLVEVAAAVRDQDEGKLREHLTALARQQEEMNTLSQRFDLTRCAQIAGQRG